MTTIVYDHKNKIIAYDGLMTAGSEIASTQFKKYLEQDGVLFFMSGTVHEMDAFVEVYGGGHSMLDGIDIFAIVVKEKVAYRAGYNKDKKYIWERALTRHYNIGSGGDYAGGAVWAGASAKEAVKIASQIDIYTGGKIRTYDIMKGKHS